MDIALCIEELVGIGAKYFGSTFDNTKECYEALRWHDERSKPKWENIILCWEQIKDRYPEIEISLEEKVQELEDRIQQLESK